MFERDFDVVLFPKFVAEIFALVRQFEMIFLQFFDDFNDKFHRQTFSQIVVAFHRDWAANFRFVTSQLDRRNREAISKQNYLQSCKFWKKKLSWAESLSKKAEPRAYLKKLSWAVEKFCWAELGKIA